jgi:hypothetical protein
MRIFIWLGIVVLALSLLLPYLFPYISRFKIKSDEIDEHELDQLPPTLQALHVSNRLVGKSPIIYSKVAVGYNTNLDLIVRALDLFEALKLSPDATAAKDLQKISTKDDLKSVFVNYFSQGSAVERFIDNEELCQEIMTTAAALPSTVKLR